MFVGDSIIRKIDKALGKNRGYHKEVGQHCGSWQGMFYFSIRKDEQRREGGYNCHS